MSITDDHVEPPGSSRGGFFVLGAPGIVARAQRDHVAVIRLRFQPIANNQEWVGIGFLAAQAAKCCNRSWSAAHLSASRSMTRATILLGPPLSVSVIYPYDWQVLGRRPEFVIMRRHLGQNLSFQIEALDGKGARNIINPEREKPAYSETGFTEVVSLAEDLNPGKYVFCVFDKRLNALLSQIGFIVGEVKLPSLRSSLNCIENLFLQCSRLRFAGNGPGKSGTTWIYRMLGNLPGCKTVDMAAANLSGIDAQELTNIGYAESFHGHLTYNLRVITELRRLNFVTLYACRDLRDQVVSEYFHKFAMMRGSHRPDLGSLLPQDMLTFDAIHQWSTSVYLAYDAIAWKRSGDCAVVRYEDLTNDAPGELRRALQKFGLILNEPLAEYITAKNSFRVMTSGRDRGEADPNSPLRNGLVGDWRNYLSAETADKLVSHYEYYYEEFGYAV
ncbi:sulfotransferase domain-containing protein [Methylobacterium radiotolerans]|uniref:sulfotransferase domain-containing protein n=1 Tax=Methylobacterium radiotolerans TaxID=31998 RepID=UPI000D5D4A31|nr:MULTISPECIES: sulfotransferase domain-containing protein [Methylobacterium]MDE3750332.1 sulfotransferase domain-containing protein [Methylobacterium radiotolerans]PVY82605.1 sulfotransferase domain-containing protein [Methylobacterium organophilum]